MKPAAARIHTEFIRSPTAAPRLRFPRNVGTAVFCRHIHSPRRSADEWRSRSVTGFGSLFFSATRLLRCSLVDPHHANWLSRNWAPAKTDKKKQIIAGIVTLVTLVFVFGVVFP